MVHFKDDVYPDILQWAPVNVISVEDCLDDWGDMDEEQICIRDPNGEFGACFVSKRFLISGGDQDHMVQGVQ